MAQRTPPLELRHGEKTAALLHYMRRKPIMRVEYLRMGEEKLVAGGDNMLTLFLRAMILYVLVFLIIRLMGKRQISDLQPFDLVFTLLIADLASNPIGNTSVPLVYGIIPILALFLLQQLAAYLSLKSARCSRANRRSLSQTAYCRRTSCAPPTIPSTT